MAASSLPTDTIFEREPVCGAGPNEIALMKILYLDGAPRTEETSNWSPTLIIDTLERLRRAGEIKVEMTDFDREGIPTKYRIVRRDTFDARAQRPSRKATRRRHRR
jgi:hypothetical protein